MTAYQDIRQFGGGYRLHVLLHKHLRLPRRPIDAGLRRIHRLWNPNQNAARRAAAAGAVPTIPADTGVLAFGPDDLPGVRAAVAVADRAWEDVRVSTAFQQRVAANKKRFLLTVLKDEDMADYPDLLGFAVSPALLDPATAYFGAVPRLSSIRLWWSPANETTVSSQLWHLDPEDDRQLKIFVNIHAVEADQGPLNVLPADASTRVVSKKAVDDLHVSDEAVERAGAAGDVLTLTGPAGAGAFVDVSRCLHYGSRGNARDRLILMLQFTAFDAPRVPAVSWAKAAASLPQPLSQRQKLALCVA
ncbi:MAG: hypothetical protein ACK4QW_05520 [Alphaproteobacteria bacterium]